MKIDRGVAAYLIAAVEAIEDHSMRTGIEQYISDTCVECGDSFFGYMSIVDQTSHANRVHAVYHNVNEGTGVETIAVLVCCEGYHMINPGMIGLDGTNWGDWTKPEEI